MPRQTWRSLAVMAGVIMLLHLVGWGVLAGTVAPSDHRLSSMQVSGLALGVTAYALGMRHAFDADHIAAIDNTTRKLIGKGQPPVSVGFWFSLGHSTIVFALVGLLTVGVGALADQLENDSSALQRVTRLVGTAVSATFLYLIGIVNLVMLVGIVKVFRGMRGGAFDDAALEEQLRGRGFWNRLLSPATAAVTKPWQMLPVGALFGLGFDTATEVGLLALAGGAAGLSLPWYAIASLPVLFAAGMSLLDTVDGCLMSCAYGWALINPVRRVYYNITVTGLSVAVALVVGSIELISTMSGPGGVGSGPLATVARVDLDHVGYAVVAVFLLTWAVAIVVWRVGRIEEKWSRRALPPAPSAAAEADHDRTAAAA